MIITRRIFNAKLDLSQPECVLGPYRASDGRFDVYADGFLHSRHETCAEAQAVAEGLRN